MARYINPAEPSAPAGRKTKPCPFCAERILHEAVKCRFCGEFLYGPQREPVEPDDELEDDDLEEEPEEQDVDDVLWYGRPSLFALAGTFIKLGTFAGLCWAAYHYQVTAVVPWLGQYATNIKVSPEHLARAEQWIDLGALAMILVAGIVLLCKIIALKSIYYEVTPDRIEWSRGIFDRRVDNLDMFRVIDLKLRRSLLECILGIGTVRLTTKDDSDPYFDFVKVRHCRYLYDVVKRAGLEADKKRGVIHLE